MIIKIRKLRNVGVITTPIVCLCKQALGGSNLEKMGKLYCVYIMMNKRNTVLYTGITSNLKKRIYEHKENLVEGFTKKYNIHKLVYYEAFNDVEQAILREKQIKAGSRNKKIRLINSMNPNWEDLYPEL